MSGPGAIDRRAESGARTAEVAGALGKRVRSLLHGVVPSHFEDPFGLAWRILRSGSLDAWFAAFSAGLKVGLTPIDLALAPLERRLTTVARAPARPILLVTGPPRSGTTLLHQVLIRCLPVAYLTNLASLMPRSPTLGVRMLKHPFANERVRFESFYGRTRSFRGPSDGLELWDAWLGPDRRAIPTSIDPAAAAAMRRFFASLEQVAGRPVVAKNNNLLGSAHLIAAALPTARFVCLRREPRYLAQSLLTARRRIHGSSEVSYGIDHQGLRPAEPLDPVRDVCRQVRFYGELEAAQRERLGEARFRTVDYDAFCADPVATVRTLAGDVLGVEPDGGELGRLEPFRASRRRTLPPDELDRLDAELHRQGVEPSGAEQGLRLAGELSDQVRRPHLAPERGGLAGP